MASSGSFKKEHNGWLTLRTDWKQSKNVAGNYSTITCTHYLINTAKLGVAARAGNTCKAGGVSDTFDAPSISTIGTHKLGTTTHKINHNSDGTKTIDFSTTYNIKATLSGSYVASITASKTGVKLDDIPRQAKITNAPDFDDEEKPTITYSNPAGTAVEKIEACIASQDGLTIIVPYREVAKVGTEGETTLDYTFNLTSGEKTALRQAANKNTLQVKFYLQTTINGAIIEPRSSLEKTLTIKNPSPVLSPSVVDSNATTKALTGDANKLIKYYSNAQFAINATAQKNSSITSRKVVCGAKSSTSASGTLNNVESGTFKFTATDTRGNTTEKTLTKTLINYVKLTCNLTASSPVLNSDGSTATTQLKISGNYFNGSFGAVANTLTIQYRVKINEGTYGSWTNATATLSGNTYSVAINKADLNYQDAYTFQARAIDKINTGGVNSVERRVKTIPVFDWGENDFKFNVDAYDKNGDKLGTEITAENQTAVSVSGKVLQESGFISITPVANTPTSASVIFRKTYKKIPTVVMSVASGVPGTQVLGYGQTGISTTGVNIVVTRTNTVSTILYYFVYGEVAD